MAGADQLRNIAIIAHVDHGKTTLVDQLLRQSGAFRANQDVAERALDSNDLERERGITILAKCTSVEWQGLRINIVDTPGHADFGGEVERILSMVDGVLLLVDAAEGPMPQTKFVTMKALARGLNPIVVINKATGPTPGPTRCRTRFSISSPRSTPATSSSTFRLLFASAKGLGGAEEGRASSLDPLFEVIVEQVPAAEGDRKAPFACSPPPSRPIPIWAGC